MNKAVFLDRDGVIIVDTHYISDPADVKLTYKAGQAIKLIKQAGYKIVVVTNQSGIARGYYTKEDYKNVNRKMLNLLKEHNAEIDLILCSPYHAQGKIKKYRKNSSMRKPGSGMFLKAKKTLNIDFETSWMVGDKPSDILAGKKLFLKTVLIKSEYHGQEEKPDYICANLYDAAKIICKR